MQDLIEFSKNVRIDVTKILNRTCDSHIGSGFSCIDILTVLYKKVANISPENIDDPNRDIILISKGHIAATVFTVLAHTGFIPKSDLDLHLKNGENYAGHTRRYTVNGVEMSAGSLGHGANIGCGMAYAKLQKGYKGRIFVLMGDGECNEGSVWEAAMFASRFNLSNIVFIVDRNNLQSYGSDKQVLDMGDMVKKFSSFGCESYFVDGHDFSDLINAFDKAEKLQKPVFLVANTIKGKGVSYMENKLEWHFKSPNDEQTKIALEELSK